MGHIKSIFRVVLFTGLFLLIQKAKGHPLDSSQISRYSIVGLQDTVICSSDSVRVSKVKFKRGKAILFTVFTGLLGGHRIYLGTHHRTPVIYSLTFGGLGILTVIDLIHLIFIKDISIYEDKSQIIMWKY